MTRLTTTLMLALAVSIPAMADDIDVGGALGSGLGGALGAYVGSEMGGRNGAVLGGGLGGAIGAVLTDQLTDDRYYRSRRVEHRHYYPVKRRGHHRHDRRRHRDWDD
jgi:outer membrane lipoprotein SlyB